MKSNRKQLLWTLALALGATVGVVSSSAQDSGSGEQHRQDQANRQAAENQNDQAKRPSYQQGAQHAQDDIANNRNRNYRGQYDNDQDRTAYQAGYDQAYGQQTRK